MKIVFFLFIILFLSVVVYLKLTNKYISPYKLYILFGKKGVGKSTMLQKLAYYYYKRGYHVYCDDGDSTLPWVTPINILALPRLAAEGSIPENSVILCDEINLLFDNRDFKNFPKDFQKYLRLQRHYKHIFIGFSQTYDCDKKIRDLADELVIVSRKARIFITSKSYVKKPVIISPETNNTCDTAKMTDDFVSIGLVGNLCSPFKAFLPKWIKKHNSFKR